MVTSRVPHLASFYSWFVTERKVSLKVQEQERVTTLTSASPGVCSFIQLEEVPTVPSSLARLVKSRLSSNWGMLSESSRIQQSNLPLNAS